MNTKEKKAYIKKERKRLTNEKAELTARVQQLDATLLQLDHMEKPYVACVQSYSGGGQMAFATLEKAEAKLEEYRGKTYFRNGLNYGVYLYQHKDDGTKEMLQVIPLHDTHFRVPDFSN